MPCNLRSSRAPHIGPRATYGLPHTRSDQAAEGWTRAGYSAHYFADEVPPDRAKATRLFGHGAFVATVESAYHARSDANALDTAGRQDGQKKGSNDSAALAASA